MMRRRSVPGSALRLASAVVYALGVASLAGCADGGSSGFDLTAQQMEEQRVIAEVTQNAACAEFDAIVICGSPLKPGSTTMGPELSDPVVLSPTSGEPLPCIGTSAGGCTATIRITGGQLPGSTDAVEAGSMLLLAIGPTNPARGWVRGEATVYAEGSDAQAELRVTVAPGDPLPLVAGTRVRIAVLLYPPGVEVAGGPSEVELLSAFGAPQTVVANDLVLQPSAP